jgi:hypothetical protein
MTKLHVVKIDETGNWNMDKLRADFERLCPERIYGVYLIADNERTYIASTQSSAWAVWLYNTWEGGVGDEFEKVYDVLNIENHGEDDYFGFHEIERLLRDRNRSAYTGYSYPTTNDNDNPERKEAWENAAERERGNVRW